MISAWGKARSEQVGARTNVQTQREMETRVPVGAGTCLGGAGAAAWASPKWEGGKQELLPPAGSDPSSLLQFLGSSSARRAPGRNNEQMAHSGVPGTHLDSPCLQAVGAGQGGGGEEDFRSKLNLLENLACSPSS